MYNASHAYLKLLRAFVAPFAHTSHDIDCARHTKARPDQTAAVLPRRGVARGVYGGGGAMRPGLTVGAVAPHLRRGVAVISEANHVLARFQRLGSARQKNTGADQC